MPCVSLAHRKIYRETVARRIEMRRLLRSTEKATAKSAQRAARLQSAQTKAALRSVKKLSKETPQQTARRVQKAMRLKPTSQTAPQFQNQPQVQTQTQPQNQNLSTLHSNLIATSKAVPVPPQPSRPLVSYISSTMQDFREGVEVKILHTKHRLSVDNPLAVNEIASGQRAMSENAHRVGAHSSLELFATNGEQAKQASPVTTGRGVAGPEKNANRSAGVFSRRPSRAELINAESSLGRTLFGPIPTGHRREFFHDRGNVWIWHEGWAEPGREPHQMTIRYEVRPTGVFKKLSAGSYVALEGIELENFRRAAHAYLYLIKRNLYHLA